MGLQIILKNSDKKLKTKVLVTGASGFIGQSLCARLLNDGYLVAGVVRKNCSVNDIEVVVVGDIGRSTKWDDALVDVDVVVHLAARAHVLKETEKTPLEKYRETNLYGTEQLARSAAIKGVKKFIFLSSIGVNGEVTTKNLKFKPDDIPKPHNDYSNSKWEAEEVLAKIGRKTGMEFVIIRPPLVYGEGVKANFHNLLCWLNKGVPLPFGAIKNKRSFISLYNLVDFIVTCIEHPKSAGQIFLVSDGDDLSTTELFYKLSYLLDRKTYLLEINEKIVKLLLSILGLNKLKHRLCCSLQIDVSKNKSLLGWDPPASVDEGLNKTVKSFLKNG